MSNIDATLVKKRKGNLPPGPGPGRPKGLPNKLTMEFRDTVRRVLEENSSNVGIWLEQVATGGHGEKPDPGKALDLLAKLAEYAAPKLARTEVVGDATNPLVSKVVFEIVDPSV
jgi:hypothetical protein